MILNVFAVYDLKAEAYMAPFFQQTKGLAIRSFAAAAHDGGSVISKYPEDFCLFDLGTWEDRTGLFSPRVAPISLGTARDFMTGVPADFSAARPSSISEIRKVVAS